MTRASHSSQRYALAAQRAEFADEAATLAPEILRIAAKYGYQPSTVAKVAVARARA